MSKSYKPEYVVHIILFIAEFMTVLANFEANWNSSEFSYTKAAPPSL